MKRVLITAVPVAALTLFALRSSASPPAPADENPLRIEPVLVFDVSGYGLAGPIHEHLAVYSNGLATHARGGGFVEGDDGAASFTHVGEAAALQLARDLYLAGAFQQLDFDQPVADLPVTTITVARPATDSVQHTFSYTYAGTAALQDIAQVIAAFADLHFPDL